MSYVLQGLLRGGIPFIIMSIISGTMSYQKIDSSQTKSTFITGIIISIVAATSVIYEIDDWSIMKQSIIHFVSMLLSIFPCLLLSGWFPLNNFLDFLKVLGIFLLTGIVLWAFFYLLFTKLLNK